jgi:hypothetical protein
MMIYHSPCLGYFPSVRLGGGVDNSLIFHYEVNYMMRYSVLLLICTLIFSSCAPPPTPAPINMAFVDIPKPEKDQEVTTPQVIPTATYVPSARIIEVAIWAPPYLAETFGGALDDALRGLVVSDETMANIRFEVGDGNPGMNCSRAGGAVP